MKGGLIIIIIVAIVAFVLDALRNKCIQNNLEVAIVVFTHHLIYVFALLGWLLDDFAFLLFYLGLPLVTWLHWNTSTCVVDDITTQLCGEQKDFHHLGRTIGWPHGFTMALVGVGWIIAAYKLVKLLRSGPPKPPHGFPPPWCAARKCRESKGKRCKA